MITYLLQVSISWVIFYGIYHAFLRKETFFSINRFYLLGTLLLGLFIPQIGQYLVTWFDAYPKDMGAVVYFVSETPYFISAVVESPAQETNWLLIGVSILYMVGLVISGLKLFHGLRKIYRLYQDGEKIDKKEFILVETNKIHLPFSFFQYVFLSKQLPLNPDLDHIIKHELTHVRSLHSLDVLAVETLGVLFWFNPILLLYKKALKQSHEYHADASVLQHSTIKNYGQILLGQSSSGLEVALANHFFNSQIKNRITMMYQKKSGRGALVKYLAAVPVLLLTMFIFSNSVLTEEDHYSKLKKELRNVVDQSHSLYQLSIAGKEVFDNYLENNNFSLKEVESATKEVLEETGVRFEVAFEDEKLANYCVYLDDAPRFTDEIKATTESNDTLPDIPHILDYFGKKNDGTFPLIVVDGIITDPYTMPALGKNQSLRMQTMRVLESKAAIATYGEKARNGAIEIEGLHYDKFDKTHNNRSSDIMNLRMSTHRTPPPPPPAPPTYGDQIMTRADIMPRFPGCEDLDASLVDLEKCSKEKLIHFIYTNLNYPKAARNHGIEGTEVLQFVVNAEGSLVKPKIVRSVDKSLDMEVLKIFDLMVAEAGKWTPGYQDGKPVNVLYTLPVRFKLEGKERIKEDYTSDETFINSVLGKKDPAIVTGTKSITLEDVVVAGYGTPKQKDRVIIGSVVNEEGEPLIGANVIVNGKNTGTITDINGKFKLEVSENAQLDVSFVGYQPEKVPSKKEMIITLKKSSVDSKIKIKINGNSLHIDSGQIKVDDEELKVKAKGAEPLLILDGVIKGRGQNIEKLIDPINIERIQVIKDKAAEKYGPEGKDGVIIITSKHSQATIKVKEKSQSDKPEAVINVRGLDNLGTQQPLYVIDGKVYNGGVDADLKPEQIHSINILKGVSAIKLYGEKGKNGVIEIITKNNQNAEIFSSADIMPRFPGCEEISGSDGKKEDCAKGKLLEFIYQNLTYPEEARINGIEGTNLIQFVVGADGQVRDPKIIRSIGESIDQAVLEMFEKMANDAGLWTPGYQNGKAVNVLYTLPVRFKLTDSQRIVHKTMQGKVAEDFLHSLEAYPNPTKGVLNVSFTGEAGPTRIMLFSLDGRVLYQQDVPDFDGKFDQQLNSDNFVNSTAFLMIIQGKKVHTEKVVFAR